MTQYIVRLAVAEDRSEVLRLQEQFIAELADPLGVAEGSHEHSEFVLIEAVDERGTRAIGITSLMRASSAPFVCEQVFPDLWEKIDLRARTGQSNIRRDDLAENDWGYVAKEHRGNRIALLGWAGSMLLAHHRGYPACLGIANQAALTTMGSAFHTVGLSSELSGVRYELGLLFPAQIAPRMAEIVRGAIARNPGIAWRVPGLDRD
jgi:GNAT superfamily N-acetyltransferase